MPTETMRRRVLLAAGTGAEESLREVFSRQPLDSWDFLEAGSFSQARFILQHSACDTTLVNDDLFHREGEAALAWLARHGKSPVIFLAGDLPDSMTRAYHLGASMCLPRSLALAHPAFLASALERAAQLAELQRCQRHTQEQLIQCRRHVDRLVNLIWRASPMEPNTQWFTQRHTVERLQEEISRTQRHGVPLTLAIAEVQAEPEEDEADLAPLDEWTSRIISESKRRCDVAGQYGLQGFLLLMVHTPRQGGVICCRRLKKVLEKAAGSGTGPRGPLHACFGLASSTSDSATAPALLRRAEQNLEAAKTGQGEGIVAE